LCCTYGNSVDTFISFIYCIAIFIVAWRRYGHPPARFRYSFICRVTSTRKQRRDLFAIRNWSLLRLRLGGQEQSAVVFHHVGCFHVQLRSAVCRSQKDAFLLRPIDSTYQTTSLFSC